MSYIIPKGYSCQIASYVKSNLGKATVLDHHVNQPNNISKYFGIALDSFFSKNPNTCGALRNKYEKEIMKKLIILFLLLFSFSVISSEKENILFENDIYRLSLDSSGNCSKLNLFNKKDKKNIPILDRLSFLDYSFNLSLKCNSPDFISWDRSFGNNYNNDFLVLNYDLIGYVYNQEEKPEKHVEYYCSILDLSTGEFLTKENSNYGFCKMDTLSLPDEVSIKTDKALLYNQPNKNSNKYLIKGDKVKIFYHYIDNKDEWYLINYKGRKEINMWIKADSVDLN